MYIVLLGAPGSGKGTQGGMISEKLNIAHLSTGDLFRGILANSNHELYKDLQVIKEGKLVSDEIVNRVVEDGLKKPEYKDGVIFDGYPRTVAQAEALDKMLDAMGKSRCSYRYPSHSRGIIRTLVGTKKLPKLQKDIPYKRWYRKLS